MNEDTLDMEALRRQLREEMYAMALSGMPAVFLDEDKINHGDEAQLLEIARQLGLLA